MALNAAGWSDQQLQSERASPKYSLVVTHVSFVILIWLHVGEQPQLESTVYLLVIEQAHDVNLFSAKQVSHYFQ